MYMHTVNNDDYFKNIISREYMMVKYIEPQTSWK
jgi:hypothetical protein